MSRRGEAGPLRACPSWGTRPQIYRNLNGYKVLSSENKKLDLGISWAYIYTQHIGQPIVVVYPLYDQLNSATTQHYPASATFGALALNSFASSWGLKGKISFDAQTMNNNNNNIIIIIITIIIITIIIINNTKQHKTTQNKHIQT